MQSKKIMFFVTASVALHMGGVEALQPPSRVVTSAARTIQDAELSTQRKIQDVQYDLNPQDAPPRTLVSFMRWCEDKSISWSRWIDDLDADLSEDASNQYRPSAPAPRVRRAAASAAAADRPQLPEIGFALGEKTPNGEKFGSPRTCWNRYNAYPITVWKNSAGEESKPEFLRYVRFSMLYEWALSVREDWPSAYDNFPSFGGRYVWFLWTHNQRKNNLSQWLAGLGHGASADLREFLLNHVQCSISTFNLDGVSFPNQLPKPDVSFVDTKDFVDENGDKHTLYKFDIPMTLAKLDVRAHDHSNNGGKQNVDAPFRIGLSYNEFHKLHKLFVKQKATIQDMPAKVIGDTTIENRKTVFENILKQMFENRHLLTKDQYKDFLTMLVRHTDAHNQEQKEFVRNLTVQSVESEINESVTYYKFGLSNGMKVWLRFTDFDSLKKPLEQAKKEVMSKQCGVFARMFTSGTDPAVIRQREGKLSDVLNDMFQKLNEMQDPEYVNQFDLFFEMLMDHAEEKMLFRSVRTLDDFLLCRELK